MMVWWLLAGLVLGVFATWHQSIGGWGTDGRLFLLLFIIPVGVVWIIAVLAWLGGNRK